MKFLVDTHVFLWAILTPERFTDRVRDIFLDKRVELVVSIATPWEIAIKTGIGKLKNGAVILNAFESRLASGGYSLLGLSVEHAIASGLLPRHHKDPFDRLLIAQALDLNVPILSSDDVFDRYGVARIW
ncbi:type II toxin-antitoxin system VapC family toxin [Acidobacteria bacterium AB60]|nr:type II toxin-antitoxin system VapC family toxin [Acidobacteria bacterium AB60]